MLRLPFPFLVAGIAFAVACGGGVAAGPDPGPDARSNGDTADIPAVPETFDAAFDEPVDIADGADEADEADEADQADQADQADRPDAAGDEGIEAGGDAADVFEVAADLPPDVDPALDSDGDGLSDLDEWKHGTDPLARDSDQDGIEDGPEVEDGTDPADPSSAKAWHPGLTARPRLFFGPADLPVLAGRAVATTGVHATLWQRATALSGGALPAYPEGVFDFGVNSALAQGAEAAALAGLVKGDAALVQKALDAIARPFPDPAYLDTYSHYNLYEAEALVSFCTAYDLAAGSPIADPASLAAARANLVKRIDTFRWMCHEGSQLFLLLFARNNHPMKAFGALGLCAIAVNDRPEAAADLSEAMTGLDFLLNDYQGTPEGGYAEGWNYLVYGSESFLPFFAAYHRWAEGRTLPYFGVPILQAGSPHEGKVAQVADFAVCARTREIYTRALLSSRPDGLMPPTDDANPAALHGGLLAWLFDDDAFLWQWHKPAAAFYSGRAATATFALADGAPPPAEPGPNLDGSWPEAGFAVFRSSWAADALFAVLQGEQGPARLAGQGHEHPDELSFLLDGWGARLVIDPGYINWEHHGLVKLSSDHNTILVDGFGAEPGDFSNQGMAVGEDAFLTVLTHDGPFSDVAVSTSYQGVDFVRRLVRVDGRYLVVEDRMAAPAAHAYAWLLNGWGGGDVPDSTFELFENGGRWTGPLARVEARVVPVGEVLGAPVATSDLAEHATNWGQWAMHERLRYEVTQAAGAGFLAAVLPSPATELLAAVPALAHPAPGVAAIAWWSSDGGTRYDVVVNRTGASVEVAIGGTTHAAAPGTSLRIARPTGEPIVRVLTPL